MLTQTQLDSIDSRLRGGEKMESIAASMNMNLQKIRYAIMASGKRMRVVRYLEDATPAAEPCLVSA